MSSSRARILSRSNGLDNTFSNRNQGSNSNNSHYADFVKQVERQRCIQEFESGNERRLQGRKNGVSSETSRQNSSSYYVGNSKYTSRPPTGVDLALGLNGYKDTRPLPKARIPSSLQNDRLEKYDYIKNFRNKNDDAEKWNSFKSEVEERKSREEQERQQFLEETRVQQLDKDSILLREERTKEIERSLPKDWDYQIGLKNHTNEKLKKESYEEASEERQLAEEKVYRDADIDAQLKNQAAIDAQNCLAESRERKFRDDNILIDEGREEAKEAAIHTDMERMEDEENRKREFQKAVAYQDVNKELIRMKLSNNDTTEGKVNESAWNEEDEKDFQRMKKAKEREDIQRHRENLAAIDKRRNLESGALADLLHGQQIQNNQQQVQRPNHSALLLNQITERKKAVEEIKLMRQAEEEARLEAEALYKASELASKERRIKEQNVYREFLNKQMEEKRNIASKLEAEERIFHQLNETSDNEKDRDEVDRVPKMLHIPAH